MLTIFCSLSFSITNEAINTVLISANGFPLHQRRLGFNAGWEDTPQFVKYFRIISRKKSVRALTILSCPRAWLSVFRASSRYMDWKLAELLGSKVVSSSTKCPVICGTPKGSTLKPILFDLFTSYLDEGTEHTPQQFWRPHKTGRSGSYTRWMYCHPEGPRQAGEVG